MGDLSWDSFEPEQGKFTFAWFDRIMHEMQAAGIRVILDNPSPPEFPARTAPSADVSRRRRNVR